MEIFRKEMKLNGFRIRDIAKAVNVTPSNVHAWIKGTYRPGSDKIKMLRSLGFSDTACLEPSKEVEV